LDVYTPHKKASVNNNNDDDDGNADYDPKDNAHNPTTSSTTTTTPKRDVVVVLVMGSAWLGHRPYIYWGTDWWNQSAPQQICDQLGYTCIAIRHSGAFLRIPKPVWIVSTTTTATATTAASFIISVMILLIGTLRTVVEQRSAGGEFLSTVHSDADVDSSPFGVISMTMIMILVMSCTMLYTFLYWESQGAATIEDMVHDVSTALSYIDTNGKDWGLHSKHNDSKSDTDRDEQDTLIPVVFGGYSSGAHIAATLLTSSTISPLILQPRQSSSLKHLQIVSVLYLSGVLDVPSSSWIMTLLSYGVLGKGPTNVPSPLQTLRTHYRYTDNDDEDENRHPQQQQQQQLVKTSSTPSMTRTSSSLSASSTRSLSSSKLSTNARNKQNNNTSTNRNRTTVHHRFGLPPHILIGAKYEVFGLPQLDSAFCSITYSTILQQTLHVPTNCIVLPQWSVNHWSILSSTPLLDALRTSLSSISVTTTTIATTITTSPSSSTSDQNDLVDTPNEGETM
jgi:hypothetical protein